jgi:predicted Zn-dependent protease
MREHRSEADSLRQTAGWVDNCWHPSVPLLHNVRNMKSRIRATALFLALIGSITSAQTRITPPGNKYKPSQDVELGRKAADEARHQLPIMHDDAVTSYVDGVGRRLVAVSSTPSFSTRSRR